MAEPAGAAAAAGVGSFRVSLSSITIERMDHVPEDDFKTWAQVVVVTRSRASAKFWFAGEAEANLGKTSVTPGNDAAAYNFARNSKDFGLDMATLSDLCSSVLQVNVFKGSSRDTAKDAWVGWFTIDLADLLGGARLKGGFGLTPPSAFLAPPPYTPLGATPSASAYNGKVQADIRPNAALEEIGVGARILSVSACQLSSLPPRWRLPASDFDTDDPAPGPGTSGDPAVLTALCDDPEENPYRYVLSLEVAPKRSLHVPTGTLHFIAPAGASSSGSTSSRPPTSTGSKAVAAATAAPAGGKGRPVTPASAAVAAAPAPAAPAAPTGPGGEGRWVVQFRSIKLFLTREVVLEMVQYVGSGALVEGLLRRVLVEPVEDDDPDDATYGLEMRRLLEEDTTYRATVSIALDSLLLQGVTTAKTELNVRPESMTDAAKAAETAKREEREASWQEYLAAKAKRVAERGAAAMAASKAAAGLKSPAKDVKDAKAKEAAAKAKEATSKAKAGGKGGKDAPVAAPVEASGPVLHPYDAAGTLLALTLSLNQPLTPRPATPPPVELTVEDLIPHRGRALAMPAGLDASQEFRREVANAVGLVAKEYAAVLLTGESAAGAQVPLELRRAELLRRLKEGGTYGGIREALRSCAIKIIRERFAFLPGYSDALGSPGRDELFAHVYAYMVGQMHTALNATFAEAERVAPLTGVSSAFISSSAAPSATHAAVAATDSSANSSPPTPVAKASTGGAGASSSSTSSSPSSASQRPRSAATVAVLSMAAGLDTVAAAAHGSTPAEPTLLRLRRVAAECEFSGHSERAARLHQTRVTMAEEAAARGRTAGVYDPAVWFDYGLFSIRRGELLKAATCLREALSCDGDFVPALLAMAALQCARGHADESIIFCAHASGLLQASAANDDRAIEAERVRADRVSERQNLLPLVHVLHALSLELCDRGGEAGGVLQNSATALARLLSQRRVSADDVARSATTGACYLLLSRYLLDLQLDSLARFTLEHANSALLDTDAPRLQRIDLLVLRSRQFLQAMNALTAVELSEYLPSGPGVVSAGGEARAAGLLRGGARRSARLDVAPIAGTGSAASSESKFGLGAAPSSGRAYDGALLSAEEAVHTLQRACELSNVVSEAWLLRGIMWSTGLVGPSHKRSVTGIDTPLAGMVDLGDLELEELVEGRRFLELASSTYEAPLHSGYAQLVHSPIRVLPAPSVPLSAASAAATSVSLAALAPATLSAVGGAAAVPAGPSQPQLPDTSRAASILASSSGVGGGLLACDEYSLVRLYQRLAALQLQLAAAEPSAQAAVLLSAAKDSYVRAVQAGRAAAAIFGAGPWSLSWLGVGRATWAQGVHSSAELALGEANALDNANPVVWAWLAFLCLSADPLRDREAAAALDQALKNSLSGDCTETVVLLHTLADRYRARGQAHVAAGLMRRAVVLAVEPISGAHQDAMLHVRMALAEVLAEGGAIEDALHQYRAVIMAKGLSGVVLPVLLKDSVRNTRHAAAAASAALLVKLGREVEAKELLTVHGTQASLSSFLR